jgi:hypothetical protein
MFQILEDLEKKILNREFVSRTMARKYALTMTHPPNICPIANKASPEAAVTTWKQLSAISQKHRVKILSFDHF